MSTTKTSRIVQPYLFFDGRCDEAIDFYRKALDAEVTTLLRFKDSPEPPQPGMCPPGSDDKVMHANLRIGEFRSSAASAADAGRIAGQHPCLCRRCRYVFQERWPPALKSASP